ncbi:MAG: 1-acyl-sn-glycerol-3-phosphate acyltransferase [Candidatus Aureabacteria bacterium]|nr:1-acyl-sn-glycerol-3-phosphate acyltransferase [Candidatus Auribacterota bacterium]
MIQNERFKDIFYFFTRILAYFLCIIWFRLKVIGQSNIPKHGGFVFASNHASHLDPVLCGVANTRIMRYLAKKELFNNFIFGWMIRACHAIPLDREAGDIKTIKIAINLLKTGRPILMYPEGTRSEDGSIGSPKRGVGFILEKAAVPVVPCYIEGSNKAMRKNTKMIYPVKIRVIVGEPITFEKILESEFSKEEKQIKISEYIIRSIKDLKTKLEQEN